MKLNKEDLPPTDGEWDRDDLGKWHSMLNGQTHNSLGPAFIYDDGEKAWLVNGKLHRLDGPAVECADGRKKWYVDGRCIHKQDFTSTVISFLLGVDETTAKIIEKEFKP